MKTIICFLSLLIGSIALHAQHPKNGTYYYKICLAEQECNSQRGTVRAVIKGDSIHVYYDSGTMGMYVKGELLDAGIIVKHRGTGKYIIAHHKADAYAKQIGDENNGPRIIDFKRRKFWLW